MSLRGDAAYLLKRMRATKVLGALEAPVMAAAGAEMLVEPF